MAFIRKLISLTFLALVATNAAEIIAAKYPNEILPNSYIIVMKSSISDEDFGSHQTWLAQLHRRNLEEQGDTGPPVGLKRAFNLPGMRGYSGIFDENTIHEISNDPMVQYIEHDHIVRISALETQRNAPSWGLGRISHSRPSSDDYVFDSSAGEGITVYGVDTGIDIEHPDFEGRATWGYNTVDQENQDGNGHGTHTAATVAGKTFGVAKKAKVIAVKVLDSQGSGTASGVIAGIEWCVSHARENGLLRKSVMNLSLGARNTQVFNQAAEAAQESGIFLSVAAGNDGTDASQFSPASARGVCTVAATARDDTATSWSNYGSIIAVYAPGDGILSAIPGGESRPLSGTSMAAPHVCGVAAYLMALEKITPDKVCDRIKELAREIIQNPGPDTTRKFLYNGSGA